VAKQSPLGAVDRRAMIADLRELIRALDRRVPRLERSGERTIAQEAAELRAKALKRIEQLTQSGT
jgi:hypothetical protein